MCSMKIAEATPATFYHQSESLVKPLLITMTYRHYKVRMASIKVNTHAHIYYEHLIGCSSCEQHFWCWLREL